MKTLSDDTIKAVNDFCAAYVEPESFVRSYFNYISDNKLVDELVTAYSTARYMYKLGLGLKATDIYYHAHLKFQITQYASIYEAVIGYMLENKYQDHAEYQKISTRQEYLLDPSGNALVIQNSTGERIFTCKSKAKKLDKISIRFDDKVDCCVSIGFVHPSLGGDIKRFYRLRNGIHLSNAIKNLIEYDDAQAKLAYRRIRPFALGIKEYLRSGRLPTQAMTKEALIELQAAKRQAKKDGTWRRQ